MSDVYLHDTGSPLLDQILDKRRRIQSALWKPRPRIIPQSLASPSTFPPLSTPNIKPLKDRLLEVDAFCGTVPTQTIWNMKKIIRQSASDFDNDMRLLRIINSKSEVLKKTITVPQIQLVVCNHFGISRDEIISSKRSYILTRPRQVAMYFSKKLTKKSLPEIGRRFGGRDHTTVIHAVRKIERLMVADAAFAEEIEMLREMLQAS